MLYLEEYFIGDWLEMMKCHVFERVKWLIGFES